MILYTNWKSVGQLPDIYSLPSADVMEFFEVCALMQGPNG